MGACATKPGELKEEAKAPLPREEQDDKKPTSLGSLFRESEERSEASDNEDITVKEAIITTEQGDTREGEEQQVETQTVETRETTKTAESKEKVPEAISVPTDEETVVPAAEERIVVELESVKEIVEDSTANVVNVEDKAEIKVEASSAKEEIKEEVNVAQSA